MVQYLPTFQQDRSMIAYFCPNSHEYNITGLWVEGRDEAGLAEILLVEILPLQPPVVLSNKVRQGNSANLLVIVTNERVTVDNAVAELPTFQR